MSQIDDAFFFAEPLSPDDRLRLIARLWASLPPDHWAAPSPAELVEVERRLAEHDAGQTADVPWEIVNRMLVYHEAAKRGKIYSAPRRFDLATIFAVITAFSLLLAVMTAFAPWSSLPVVGLVAFVALGQALLFRGMRPRLASILVGIVCFTLPMIFYSFVSPRMMPEEMLLVMLLNTLIGGALFGYVAGVMIGGVFLVADVIRRRFEGSPGGGAPAANAAQNLKAVPPTRPFDGAVTPNR